jgi:hypothetical protein
MKMTIRSLVTCALATAAFAVPATADAEQSTKGGCPPGTWVLNNADQWVAATEAGILAEGSTMGDQAVLFGFVDEAGLPDVASFVAWIIEGVFGEAVGIDANRDGLVCRATNTPSGYPEFYFQVHDNKYHAKFAG